MHGGERASCRKYSIISGSLLILIGFRDPVLHQRNSIVNRWLLIGEGVAYSLFRSERSQDSLLGCCRVVVLRMSREYKGAAGEQISRARLRDTASSIWKNTYR